MTTPGQVPNFLIPPRKFVFTVDVESSDGNLNTDYLLLLGSLFVDYEAGYPVGNNPVSGSFLQFCRAPPGATLEALLKKPFWSRQSPEFLDAIRRRCFEDPEAKTADQVVADWHAWAREMKATLAAQVLAVEGRNIKVVPISDTTIYDLSFVSKHLPVSAAGLDSLFDEREYNPFRDVVPFYTGLAAVNPLVGRRKAKELVDLICVRFGICLPGHIAALRHTHHPLDDSLCVANTFCFVVATLTALGYLSED